MGRRRVAERKRPNRVCFTAGGGEAEDCRGRRERAMNRHAWLILLLASAALLATNAAAEPNAIFLVRHAERAAISGRVPSDTGLSPEGKTRAQNLARELKDAGITTIFTSEYKRTQETATPLA